MPNDIDVSKVKWDSTPQIDVSKVVWDNEPQQSYQDRRLALVQSPEFKSASLDQRKAMMSKFLEGEGNAVPVKPAGMLENIVKEPVRFAEELVKVPLSSAKKGAYGLGAMVKYGESMYRNRELPEEERRTKALEEANTLLSSYEPVKGFTEPSMLGGVIGGAIEKGSDIAEKATGETGLARAAITAGTDIAGLLGGVKGGKAGVEFAKAKAPSATATILDKFSPNAKEPVGSFSKHDPKPNDFKQKMFDSRNDTMLEKRFRNAVNSVQKPGRVGADPIKRTENIEGIKTGINEIEQQAAEGRIDQHNINGVAEVDVNGEPVPYSLGKGGTDAAFMPVSQGLSNLWRGEIMPILEKSKAWGASVEVANELMDRAKTTGGSIGNALKEKAAEMRGIRLDPVQLQGKITELNDVLYKTKGAKLGIEDTIKRNAMKQELGAYNSLLDSIVDTGMEEMGLGDLKSRWGGTRKLLDWIIDANEKKQNLKRGLEAIPGVEAAEFGFGGHFTKMGVGRRIAARMFENPDAAFDTMVRARRAQNKRNPVHPREVYTGEQRPSGPKMMYDDSTGMMINAEAQGGVGRQPIRSPSPPRTTAEEAMRFDPTIGVNVPVRESGSVMGEAGPLIGPLISDIPKKPQRPVAGLIETREKQVPTKEWAYPLYEGEVIPPEKPSPVAKPQVVVNAEPTALLPAPATKIAAPTAEQISAKIAPIKELAASGMDYPAFAKEVMRVRGGDYGAIMQDLSNAGFDNLPQLYESVNTVPKDIPSAVQKAYDRTTDITRKRNIEKAYPNIAKVAQTLKQQIKDLGGGKVNTAKVAAMIGVPAAVLTKFLLGDDEERKAMLSGSVALGGLMMGVVGAGDLPFYAREGFKFQGGSSTPLTTPKRAYIPQTVTELQSHIANNENFTAFDAARALEGMEELPLKIERALKNYQKAEQLDRRLKGRGDMDTAAERLFSAVENY